MAQQSQRQQTNDTDWRPLIGPIALRLADHGLIGAVNRHQSKKTNLRFNSAGSLAVDLTKATWFDHEHKCGGGVLDLVMYGIGGTKAEALRWLKDNEFLPPKCKEKKVRAARGSSRIVGTYNYRDALGELIFQVVRYEPKDFRQRRPKPDGGWIWDIKGMQPLPYRLQELAEAVAAEQPIVILEGEKKCDHAAQALGVVTTTNAGGGGNWRAELNAHFRGADVVLVPDNDDVGREHMRDVTAHLRGIASKLRILDLGVAWPECPHKGDISNWIDAGGDAAEFWQMLEEHAVAPVHATHSTAESAAQHIFDSLPVIQRKPGNRPQCVDEAEQHLIAAEVPFYQRGKELVRPFTFQVAATNNRKTTIAGVLPVTVTFAQDQMGRHMTWQRWRPREKCWGPADADKDAAEALLDRAGHWKFPALQGILTTPTLRPDGTILSQPGYDAQTQLLLVDPPIISVSQKPTRVDAIEALAALNDLLREFPFVSGVSRSVALSAIITIVARGGFPVPPLHVASATTAGTGKSYLWDVASAIGVGQTCNTISPGPKNDEAEIEKRLVACVLAGYPLFSVDNVNGELGGAFLCQLTERPTVTPRILGRSEQPLIRNSFTVLATGNNIRLRGDMVRRSLISQLDAGMERPETRRFKDNPVEKVLADRGFYIGAALTIVRAYLVAGQPDRPPPYASYEPWSDRVRGSLMWLGQPDPVDSLIVVRSEDPELQTLTAMLDACATVIGLGPSHAQTAAQILKRAETNTALQEAIEGTNIMARKSPSLALGNWLTDRKGRIVGGRKFERLSNDGKKASQWYITEGQDGGLGVSGG